MARISNIGQLESGIYSNKCVRLCQHAYVLHDDYVICFLAFGLECFDCSYIPYQVEMSHDICQEY